MPTKTQKNHKMYNLSESQIHEIQEAPWTAISAKNAELSKKHKRRLSHDEEWQIIKESRAFYLKNCVKNSYGAWAYTMNYLDLFMIDLIDQRGSKN